MMGALGTTMRNFVRNLINSKNLRSTLTLTPITRTKGDEGGYGAVTESAGDSSTLYAIPTDYLKDQAELLKFGDLRTGELRIIVRDDETIDTNDRVTFESSNYNIRSINPIFFNDVTIAQELVMSEKLA